MAVITRGFGGRRRDDADLPPWSVPHGRLQPCPARETAPTRPVAFGASASSFEPDVREPEAHTATGSTAWCFWSAGTSVYAAS